MCVCVLGVGWGAVCKTLTIVLFLIYCSLSKIVDSECPHYHYLSRSVAVYTPSGTPRRPCLTSTLWEAGIRWALQHWPRHQHPPWAIAPTTSRMPHTCRSTPLSPSDSPGPCGAASGRNIPDIGETSGACNVLPENILKRRIKIKKKLLSEIKTICSECAG